jgi:hypothetical protein
MAWKTTKPVGAANTTPVNVVKSGTVTWGPFTIAGGDAYWFTIAAPGVTSSMRVALYTSQDFTTIPGFIPSIKGGQISVYPPYISSAGGQINVKFVNYTPNPVTVGPVTLNWSAYNK